MSEVYEVFANVSVDTNTGAFTITGSNLKDWVTIDSKGNINIYYNNNRKSFRLRFDRQSGADDWGFYGITLLNLVEGNKLAVTARVDTVNMIDDHNWLVGCTDREASWLRLSIDVTNIGAAPAADYSLTVRYYPPSEDDTEKNTMYISSHDPQITMRRDDSY